MRIAHCIHGLGLGGAQKVIATLLRGGVLRGGVKAPAIERQFVYSSGDGVLRQEIEDAGATVRIIERRLPKLDPIWTLGLRSAMKRDRIDLVHCHLFGDTLHGLYAARPLDVPVIATVHCELNELPTFQRWGYRRVLPQLAATVACGERVAQSLIEALPGLEPILIPNGIDAIELDAATTQEASRRLREELEIPQSALLIAAIGRLTEQKAPSFLLESFAKMQSQECHLVFIGDGPLRSVLQSVKLPDGVRKRVHYAGFRDRIVDLLPSLDVVVFASDFEGLPIALLEAMATARALVVTDVAGMLEAVSSGVEALVVVKRDVLSLTSALERVTAEPALRSDLGAAAQRRFKASYGSELMVASYHELYRKVRSKTAKTNPSGMD